METTAKYTDDLQGALSSAEKLAQAQRDLFVVNLFGEVVDVANRYPDAATITLLYQQDDEWLCRVDDVLDSEGLSLLRGHAALEFDFFAAIPDTATTMRSVTVEEMLEFGRTLGWC